MTDASGGEFFGTLCAIDPHPARLNNPEILGMFKLFAELIAAQLDADERLREANFRDERQLAELRDQLIAVLGHDLRNPVAALGAGTKMLMRTPLDAKATNILALMQGSVLRMGNLIDNLLDLDVAGCGLVEPVLTPSGRRASRRQSGSGHRLGSRRSAPISSGWVRCSPTCLPMR